MGVKERVLDSTSGAIALVDRPGSALGILHVRPRGKSRIPLSGDTPGPSSLPAPVGITEGELPFHGGPQRLPGLRWCAPLLRLQRRVIGEYVILGPVYRGRPTRYPLLRLPWCVSESPWCAAAAWLPPRSYSDKALLGALEDYPRLSSAEASVNRLTETPSAASWVLEERARPSLPARGSV